MTKINYEEKALLLRIVNPKLFNRLSSVTGISRLKEPTPPFKRFASEAACANVGIPNPRHRSKREALRRACHELVLNSSIKEAG